MNIKDKQILTDYVNLKLNILTPDINNIDLIYICRYINLILKAYDMTIEDIKADIKAEFNYNIEVEVIKKVANIEREVTGYR